MEHSNKEGNKMKRKILVLFFPIFLIIPISNTFAMENWDYSNGLLDDENFRVSNTLPESVYDNNLETYHQYNSSTTKAITLNLDLISLADIYGLYFKGDALNNTSNIVRIRFIENSFSGDVVHTQFLNRTDNGYMDLRHLDLANIYRISVYFMHGPNTDNKIYQLEFFGDYELNFIELPEIKNLSKNNVSTNSVELFWDNPTDESFSHVDIYKNSELIVEEYQEEIFYSDNLEPNTDYEYTIITVDHNGNRSIGKKINITTKHVKIEELKNLVSEVDVYSVDFSWSLPESEYFSHLIIERDGLEISNDYTSSSFLNTGLEPDTTYIFKFITVYNDGTKSDGIIQSVTTNEFIEYIPLIPPNNPIISEYNGSITISFDKPTGNISGYNIYINGELYNDELLINTHHIITGLDNNKTYDIQLSSVDLDGNESELSEVYQGTPDETSLPIFRPSYSLQDVSTSVSNWFSGLWQLLAFAVSIPVSFIIGGRIRNLFV